MTDEIRTSFDIPVYASVWRSHLEEYIAGEIDTLKDYHVQLLVGSVPADYSEYDSYMPVGKVTVNIPPTAQRVQTELLALEAAIEAEIERGVQKLEELKERKQQLLALPHLPD